MAIVQEDESYGSVLAAGNFDGNDSDDLAIGDPRKDVVTNAGTVSDVGAVHVLYGAAQGVSVRLSAQNSQLWNQNVGSVGGVAEPGDRFGSALASGDFNGDGRSDLAIGEPFEDVVAIDAGMVNIVYGSANRLTSVGNQKWHQAVDGIYGDPTVGDHFGFALAGRRSPNH